MSTRGQHFWTKSCPRVRTGQHEISRPPEQYREFVEQGIPEGEQQLIQQRVQQNGLTGNSAFVDEVELRVGIRIEYRARGRPRCSVAKNTEIVINNSSEK